jgi:hypothetical protein
MTAFRGASFSPLAEESSLFSGGKNMVDRYKVFGEVVFTISMVGIGLMGYGFANSESIPFTSLNSPADKLSVSGMIITLAGSLLLVLALCWSIHSNKSDQTNLTNSSNAVSPTTALT